MAIGFAVLLPAAETAGVQSASWAPEPLWIGCEKEECLQSRHPAAFFRKTFELQGKVVALYFYAFG